MNASEFLDHTFFFICYPSASGGTHLWNLLNLESTMGPRTCENHSDFYNSLLDYYTNPSDIVAHVDLLVSPIDKSRVFPYIDKLDHQKYNKSAFLGHIDSYDVTRIDNKRHLDAYVNKKVIVITFNTDQSKKLIAAREKKIWNTDTININRPILNFLSTLYSRDYFIRQFSVHDLDIIEIEACRLFNKDIAPVINTINTQFGLSIPVDMCQILHNLWLKNIIKYEI